MTIKEALRQFYKMEIDDKAAIAELVQVALWTADPTKADAFRPGLNLMLEAIGVKLAPNTTDLTFGMES